MSAGLSDDPVFVGPYRLVNRIGEGGMGVVHLALDPNGRAVALKLLRPHIAADPDARRRLVREVDTLRRVRHPHVAPVLDADLTGDIPYVVTAFVPGQTVEDWILRRGPLTPEHVAYLGRTLADALRAIHSVGVVHRDLKPSNVMLVDGQPVVIDFGIAHMVDETRITMTGLVMGTPGYLSPEVVDGQPVTAATDWWGWGATLAYAATGRPPFGSGTATVVLDRVRRGACDLAGVDARLAGVLAAALVVDPWRRAPVDVLLQGLAGLGAWTPTFGTPASRTAPASAPGAGPAVAAQPRPQVDRGARTVVEPPRPHVDRGARTVVGPPPASPPGPPVRIGPPPAVTVPYAPVPTRPYADASPAAHQPVAHQPVGQAPGTDTPAVRPAAPPATGHPGGAVQPVRPAAGGGVAPAPEPGVVTATMLLGLATLAGLAAVAPGLAIILSVLWLFVARLVDVTVTGLLRRRYQRGPRPGDVAAAVAALPWRVLVAVPVTLATLVVPALMAASIAFFAAAGVEPSAPHPDSAGPLAAGLVAGWLAAWWGPGGGTVRRGTRVAARGSVRRRPVHVAVLVVLAFVCTAALLVAGNGSAPDWAPFGTPRIGQLALPSTPSGF